MMNYSNESRRLILPTKSNVSTLRPSAYAGMVKNNIFYLLLICELHYAGGIENRCIG